MIQELVYTSAPRGLKAGARGFCTVAATPGMGVNLASRLEMLSGYKHLFPPGHERAASNPINYSHLVIREGGQTHHILSRVSDAGLDYSNRSNKLAWHLVLDPQELPPVGPAALLAQPGVIEPHWQGEPRIIQPRRNWPNIVERMAPCQSWQTQAGDAGWAGALLERWRLDARAPSYVIYPAGADALPLIVEALSLLPPRERWQVTFSTYFTKLPPDIPCAWRFLVDGTDEAAAARRLRGPLVIDLTARQGRAPDSEWSEVARTGRRRAAAPEISTSPAPVHPTAKREARATASAKDDSRELSVAPLVMDDAFGSLPSAGPPIAPGRKRKSRRVPLVAAVALLLLVVGGVGGFVAVRWLLQDKQPVSTATVASAAPLPSKGDQAQERPEKPTEEQPPKKEDVQKAVPPAPFQNPNEPNQSTTDGGGAPDNSERGGSTPPSQTISPGGAEGNPDASSIDASGDVSHSPESTSQLQAASEAVAVDYLTLPAITKSIDPTKDIVPVSLTSLASFANPEELTLVISDATATSSLKGDIKGNWLVVHRESEANLGPKHSELMQFRLTSGKLDCQYLDRRVDPLLHLLVLRAVRGDRLLGLIQLIKPLRFNSAHLIGTGKRVELLSKDQVPIADELWFECRIGDQSARQPLTSNKRLLVRSHPIPAFDFALLEGLTDTERDSLRQHYPTRVDAFVTPHYRSGTLKAELQYAVATPSAPAGHGKHIQVDSAVRDAHDNLKREVARLSRELVSRSAESKDLSDEERKALIEKRGSAIGSKLQLENFDEAQIPFKLAPSYRVLRIVDGVDVVFAESLPATGANVQ